MKKQCPISCPFRQIKEQFAREFALRIEKKGNDSKKEVQFTEFKEEKR